MSYADVAASGPKQTPAEAAAPPAPQVVPSEATSTASLVDVDMPSVHTVPSDFNSQTIQTDTQAERLEREDEATQAKKADAEARAKTKARDAASKAKTKARRADGWLTKQFSQLTSGEAGGLVIANMVGVIGVSSYLGYRAWGLYERGRLSWGHVGVGAGILAGVGLLEGIFGGYMYRGQKKNN